MYGFHKVPHLLQGALKHDQPSQSELWEFSNACFHRDQPELLSKVQRKRSGKERDHAAQAHAEEARQVGHTSHALTRGDYPHLLGDPADLNAHAITPVQLNNLMTAIQGIKNNQRTLIEEISQLQHTSHALWQQGIENRQQTRKQQDTINRILRFMASVFGSSNVGDMLHNTGDNAASDPMQNKKDASFNGAGSVHKTHGPMRPQKRQRLLIGNTSHTMDQPMEDGEYNLADESNDFPRFSDATSNKQTPSPTNSWTQITEKLSPESSKDTPPRTAKNTPNTGNSWQPQTPLQSNQALMNALASPGDNSPWINSILAAQSPENSARLDPQLLAALQNALASQNSSGDTTAFLDANNPNMHQSMPLGPDNGAGNSSWRPDTTNQALIPTGRGFPYVQNNDAGNPQFPLPEEQFAQDVQRMNRSVQSNVDQTAKLQNSINALVQSLRLDPGNSNNKQAQPAMPVNSVNPPLNSLASPSSYVSSGTPNAPPNTNTSGEFDLDSFLNQFVDPMNSAGSSHTTLHGATPSSLPGGTPSPIPNDGPGTDPSMKEETET